FSAPAVDDAMVVVHTRNDLVAVDVGSGEELWRYDTGGSWSAPTMVDGVVYVGSNGVAARMGLHLIDAETGEAIARFEEVGTMNGSPVVTGGIVYAAGDDGLFAYGPASAVPATPEAVAPVIGPFIFSTQVDQNNEPVDEVTSYPSGTTAIYVVYDFAGVPDGVAWRMVWTVDGEVIYDGENTWQRGEEGRAADWISANEGALPDGTYEVVLYLEGVERQRGTVTIGG
ncbi:MAG TPA: PQQ-binding-like beta-propeller repeat protein, partial [Thermomicrobiales bacterium]|nr:PQQ-binding-like beta-propeller repeat protein [Thermomicrobiales bacterium]